MGSDTDGYLATIVRLEPTLHMVDRDAALASIAISIKRIADLLEAKFTKVPKSYLKTNPVLELLKSQPTTLYTVERLQRRLGEQGIHMQVKQIYNCLNHFASTSILERPQRGKYKWKVQ